MSCFKTYHVSGVFLWLIHLLKAVLKAEQENDEKEGNGLISTAWLMFPAGQMGSAGLIF